ncbi:MAG: transcriptional regulator [Microgenomates group bacterium GW2011_GWB1_44_8]|nr:MAG: transcriptional regulator [Microgenomates group bacterium GW2011_GWB1_44_8]
MSMSGHSKWATIHRQKGINDAKKGAIFTKLARAISIAVKQGQGLQLALEKAKQYNMPKDNIQRALHPAQGELYEALFEGFGPSGVAIMVSVVTDNKLRTAQAVREVLEKNGGHLGSQGAVAYLFSHEGEIIAKPNKPVEEAELEVIDLGIDDIEAEGDKLLIYCHRDQTFELKEKLEKSGYAVESAELVMKPVTLMEIENEDIRQKIESLLFKLEDLDDVQKVWTNYS